MLDYEKISIYLPKYLTPSNKAQLFDALKDFPKSQYKNFYWENHENYLCQGDGIKNLLVTNLPQKDFEDGDCMILSNTCDVNPDNSRLYPINIVYSPIVEIEKFKDLLNTNGIDKNRIDGLINSIKEQKKTSVFFIPAKGSMKESIVFLDKLTSCNSKADCFDEINKKRLFSLSDFGFYLFILKLSIHFTRIYEDINRNSDVELTYSKLDLNFPVYN